MRVSAGANRWKVRWKSSTTPLDQTAQPPATRAGADRPRRPIHPPDSTRATKRCFTRHPSACGARHTRLGGHRPAPGLRPREQVGDLLYRFHRRCADADLPELQRPATTAETWWPEILAFLHTGITNVGSEGTNRVIKTIARDAYGFRDPGNQRLRTRYATTRRARGHLDAR
ncbi:transposase [Streptomyces sp. NPDC058001]|uniref:transposase n=1 Tax=Streptomyces sp. NPDC058001 TaxID=3346300 RepID=UPI0036E550FA